MLFFPIIAIFILIIIPNYTPNKPRPLLERERWPLLEMELASALSGHLASRPGWDEDEDEDED